MSKPEDHGTVDPNTGSIAVEASECNSLQIPSYNVWFRGRMVTIKAFGDVGMLGIVLALLALEDDRVDAVLGALNFRITDSDGEPIWPPARKPPIEVG